ncbi:hypothetical protein [Spongiactinospora gelatinilytica]|uniref:hypothetical protein n=1 Tax=Spongiactinospora gelatinilytica TaxID=2666298 RepID=UPI0011B937B3|nr:hypothetical protein [Spongiactinospora gelatinilytica]
MEVGHFKVGAMRQSVPYIGKPRKQIRNEFPWWETPDPASVVVSNGLQVGKIVGVVESLWHVGPDDLQRTGRKGRPG